MNPIRIDPQRALDDAVRFNQKLAAGLKTLRTLDDVDYGATDKEEVYREDKLVLYRFKGSKAPTAKTPLLIAYALVNRPYMVDLQDDRSLVKNLLALGEDVYLIDWGYPDQSDRYLTLDDYINGYIRRCVDVVAKRHKVDRINLLGICQGGAFSLCFASIYPQKIRNLITMVTPVDFHTPDNMLSAWTRSMDVDLFVDTLGNVPADQKQAILSNGISEAMNNTAFGLGIAVSCIIAHLFLTAYAKKMVETVELSALKLENLLSRRQAGETSAMDFERSA